MSGFRHILYQALPRLMMRPDWYLLWVEIRWTLTPKRFRPKVDDSDFGPFEKMGEPDVVGREIQ